MLSPSPNDHRPCLFVTKQHDAKGRVRKRYRDQDTATPYERLKSLPDATRWLEPGVTFASVGAVRPRLTEVELELADLVPTEGKSGTVIAFDPELDAKGCAEIRGRIERRRGMAEPNPWKCVDTSERSGHEGHSGA